MLVKKKGSIMKYGKMLFVLVMVMFVVCLSGCIKPPLVEQFKEIKNNETAFVVQLEGSQQAKLDSLDSLQKMQVSTKRINIPLRWRKTGRWSYQGEWIPTVDIIIVNRSPVTREWSADLATGTNKKDEGVWVESMDSIGFSTGINCTAMVEEQNAALFLYHYTGGSLASIMDAQIRNEIQAVASEVAAKYRMDDCRERKLEIIKVIREVVIPKFAKTGITISTVGMFGGFAYEDKEIQASINKTFVAQQEKVVSKAQLEAQTDKNFTIEKAAVGVKNAAITRAEGEAEAVKIKANAEASAILSVAKAAQEANSNPVFLELKKLEVEMARLGVWDGKYPNWITDGGGERLGIFVNAPAVQK